MVEIHAPFLREANFFHRPSKDPLPVALKVAGCVPVVGFFVGIGALIESARLRKIDASLHATANQMVIRAIIYMIALGVLNLFYDLFRPRTRNSLSDFIEDNGYNSLSQPFDRIQEGLKKPFAVAYKESLRYAGITHNTELLKLILLNPEEALQKRLEWIRSLNDGFSDPKDKAEMVRLVWQSNHLQQSHIDAFQELVTDSTNGLQLLKQLSNLDPSSLTERLNRILVLKAAFTDPQERREMIDLMLQSYNVPEESIVEAFYEFLQLSESTNRLDLLKQLLNVPANSNLPILNAYKELVQMAKPKTHLDLLKQLFNVPPDALSERLNRIRLLKDRINPSDLEEMIQLVLESPKKATSRSKEVVEKELHMMVLDGSKVKRKHLWGANPDKMKASVIDYLKRYRQYSSKKDLIDRLATLLSEGENKYSYNKHVMQAEECVISGGTGGHAVLFVIKQSADGSYTFTVYNSGEGVYIDHSIYKAGTVHFKNIPAHKLNAQFFRDLRAHNHRNCTMDCELDFIRSHFGQEEYLSWHKPQAQGSCPYKCLAHFLHDEMGSVEWFKFKTWLTKELIDEYNSFTNINLEMYTEAIEMLFKRKNKPHVPSYCAAIG